MNKLFALLLNPILLVVLPLSANDQIKVTSAQRIVALAPHIVENLYQIGAGERIIATTEHADYPQAAKKIPRVGNYAQLNIEQILAADPDLVIAWQTGTASEDLARLEKYGIAIEYSNPKEVEDVAKELLFFGRLTGLEQEAELQAKQVIEKLETIKQAYSDKAPISVFYELWPRPLTTIAREAWLQKHLDICGATNPFVDAKTDYPQINIEQVVLKGPQVIIQPRSHSSNTPDQINSQQWPQIPAVKHKAFIHPDADKLYRTTSRSFEELAKLCQSIDSLRTKYN